MSPPIPVLSLPRRLRVASKPKRHIFLPPKEAKDGLFSIEEERHIHADNPFSFPSVRLEATRHLPDQNLQVR